jgi:ADP-ribose pyrophosphatase
VVLVRQFRPPVRQGLVEIPAGLLDVAGEDALTCASRELIEETGYEAQAIEFLGGVFVSPGSTDHYVHLFLAQAGADPVGPPEPGITVELRPFAAMVRAAADGKVRDAKTALALLMTAHRRALP